MNDDSQSSDLQNVLRRWYDSNNASLLKSGSLGDAVLAGESVEFLPRSLAD
jgi:hypothetical protein